MKSFLALILVCAIPCFAAAADHAGAGVSPDFAIPAWITYCGPRWSHHVFCSEGSYEASLGLPALSVTTAPSPLGAFQLPQWGATAAALTTNYPANLLKAWQSNATIVTQMANLPTVLGLMSNELLAYDHGGYTAQLLKLFAQHGTAAELRIIQSAFGPTLMAPAMTYAPAAVVAEYNALPAQVPLFGSAYYWSQQHRTAPTTNTAMDYLECLVVLVFSAGSDNQKTVVQKTNHYAGSVLGDTYLNFYMGQVPVGAVASGSSGLKPESNGVQAEKLGPGGWFGVIWSVFTAACPSCVPNAVQATYDWLSSIPSDLEDTYNTLSNIQPLNLGYEQIAYTLGSGMAAPLPPDEDLPMDFDEEMDGNLGGGDCSDSLVQPE
jgi:hypothetical protein